MKQENNFRLFDKVLLKEKYKETRWFKDVYSHETDDDHVTLGCHYFPKDEYYILPLEGNEHLIGTSDVPGLPDEVQINEGEYIFATSDENANPLEWIYTVYNGLSKDGHSIRCRGARTALFCVRFKRFNPYDMEETRRHVLTVVDGHLENAGLWQNDV